jgi:hypothetical protein
MQKQLEVEKLTEAISKLKLYDNPEMDFALSQRQMKDGRIRELERELKIMKEEKQRQEIEGKIFLEKFNELKINYDDISYQYLSMRNRESEEVNLLEKKIEKLNNDMEFIAKENRSLRLTDDKCRHELISITKLKEKFEIKYRKSKEENRMLREGRLEMENKMKLQVELSRNETVRKKEEEDEKKEKLKTKHKIIEEMQNKIMHYKTLRKIKNPTND